MENLPENVSLPLDVTLTPPAERKTNQSFNECTFSMGTVNLEIAGDLEGVSDGDLREKSVNNPKFKEMSNQEKVLKSDCMGTICLESLDHYDETLDSDYEEPGSNSCLNRAESKNGQPVQPAGRKKYKVRLQLLHGGRKVSVKLRKCSISLARLSRQQIEQTRTRKKAKRREVWISRANSVTTERREKVRTLLDPLKPLVPQLKRLHLLLPDTPTSAQTDLRTDLQNSEHKQ